MLNQVLLVGRLTSDPKINEVTENRAYETGEVTIAVPRNYKNIDGIYETDFIKCILLGNSARSTMEYCKKGDLLGIRGKLQVEDDKLMIIADRISFLSTKSVKGDETNE